MTTIAQQAPSSVFSMDKITRQYVRDLELGLSGRVALCLAMEARKPLIALTDDEPSTDAWRAAGR